MSSMLPKTCIAVLFTLVLALGQAFGQASQLIPGEQCFSAGAPTSGGTVGVITTLGSITGGSGYGNATYSNVPLTGGSGQGATATITVSGGAVTAVTVSNPGFHYAAGDSLSAANANLGGSGSGFTVPVSVITGTGTGMVGVLGTITGGTGGATGTYGGVALTGGTGSGATANITVAGGAVTAVAILNPGAGYAIGDVLSATSGNIGNVSGFSVPVASVAINASLAGGTVGYYIPNTNSFKQTWKNAGQTSLNQNPVTLDANGCAIVYGTGTYRQILKDSLGNVVWDQLTTALAIGNNSYWAGQAGGTANAITVTDANFTGQDGSIINFIPLLSNTSAATLNPSSFGAIPIVKDTASGPVALTGGEIVVSGGLGNIVSVQYSATQVNFHLLNTVIPTTNAALFSPCQVTGLKMVNGSSSSTVTITARALSMATTAGVTILRGSSSFTVNIGSGNVTSTAGGMDGESPGTSAWVDLFAIDNGTTTSGLGSAAAGNGLSPVLPSGYTYKCYLGAFRVNSSGNLLGQVTYGTRSQYVVGGANVSNLPLMVSGTSGSATVPTWTAVSVSAYVPPTATTITMALNGSGLVGASGVAGLIAAPNNSYGGINSTANPPPLAVGSNVANTTVLYENITGTFVLESTNVYYASSFANGSLAAIGWIDAVNAD